MALDKSNQTDKQVVTLVARPNGAGSDNWNLESADGQYVGIWYSHYDEAVPESPAPGGEVVTGQVAAVSSSVSPQTLVALKREGFTAEEIVTLRNQGVI